MGNPLFRVTDPVEFVKEYDTVILALGLLIKAVFDYFKHRLTKQVESQKIEVDSQSKEVDAAKKIVEVFSAMIDPLQQRITQLEKDAINNRQIISDLNSQVIVLRQEVCTRDLTIVELTSKNDQLTRRVQQQEQRIAELENELRKRTTGAI